MFDPVSEAAAGGDGFVLSCGGLFLRGREKQLDCGNVMRQFLHIRAQSGGAGKGFASAAGMTFASARRDRNEICERTAAGQGPEDGIGHACTRRRDHEEAEDISFSSSASACSLSRKTIPWKPSALAARAFFSTSSKKTDSSGRMDG